MRKERQSDDFAPDVLHRDEHLELLGKNLKQSEPENIFLIGPSGTGKTVSLKNFLATAGDILLSLFLFL